MQIAQIICWFIWTPVGVPFCQDIKFCGMGMDMYCQREVLREATIYTTIAMGLHFLSQSEKVDFAFLAIPWQKTWNSCVYYYLTPPSVPFRLFHRPNSHGHS